MRQPGMRTTLTHRVDRCISKMGFSLRSNPIFPCANRESNPDLKLGKLAFYHYTIGATFTKREFIKLKNPAHFVAAMPQFKSKILQITQETHDVKTFKLEYPKGRFGFQAGQFLMASTGYIDEKKLLVKRAFSIASAPHETSYLEICVKRKEPPSFSAALHGMKAGDTLFIEGPYGRFALKEPVAENTIFVAGGAGIAPLRSMIKTILNNNKNPIITLLFSFHNPEDYIYRQELEKLAATNENFKLFASMSAKAHAEQGSSGHREGEKEFKEWKGLRGRVTAHLHNIIKDGQKSTAYICGPPPMVSDTVKLLLELGLKEENIHKEAW